MIDWETCKADFEWDGSWRDIYVLDTKPEDWVELFSMLRKDYVRSNELDEEASLPSSNEEVLNAAKTSSKNWNFRVGRILVVCHLFALTRIEFDIDPREVLGQPDLDSLCQFLQRLGDALGKSVILTPESFAECPIITYEPRSTSFRYDARP